MSILVLGVALKRFTGAVKPFFNLDGLNLTIRYGEIVALAEWQTNHPSFQFALENGWVMAVDRKTVVFNPKGQEVKPDTVRPKNKNRKSAEIAMELPEKGLDPLLLQEILDKQEGFVKQAQKTFERLTAQKKEPEPTVTPEMFMAVLENQKRMMEMLEKEKSQPQAQPPQMDQTAVLNALKLLTNEVKRLQDSKPEAPVNTDQILEGVKQVMSQFTPSSSTYNGSKKDASGFQIRDDFEEKFIPKVEDLEVKNSKIVAQEKDSGSVEDALAALRKLKEKK